MLKIYQLLNIIAKILILAFCTACCVVNAANMADFDDWVISGKCSQSTDILCHGYYKPLPLPVGTQNRTQPIKVTADKASFVAKGTSLFSGNVIATQGDKAIYADKAEVVHDAAGDLQSITAFGHVKIMQPGMRVDGSKAIAYIGPQRETIQNAVYRLYDKHARGEATSIVVDHDTKLTLCDSTYTTCAPDSKAWYLKASTTVLDKSTGRGEAWNARLYTNDIPVFYFPYVNFPIDKRRQTGCLQPEFENSSLNGATFIVPYYLNLAPNYDATVTTNYMTLRSFKFDSIFRYLTHNSFGEINFDFLPKDRAYRALRETAYANPSFVSSTNPATVVRRDDLSNSNFRYRVALKNNSYWNKHWLFTIDFTNTSDGNYLYDFQPDSSSYVTDRSSSLYALQRACLQNFNRTGTWRAQVERYQVFHVLKLNGSNVVNGPSGTEQLTKLPAVDYNSAILTLPLGLQLYGLASYINFGPQTIADSGTALTYGQRFHIRPALSYPIIRPGWFIVPRAQLNYVQYEELSVSPTHPNLAMPMYDLKIGMIFERDTRFMRFNLLQTLEPTLYYLYVPNKNQSAIPNLDSGVLTFDYNQVFRDNRYTGGDYVNDVSQLGMGIASKFYNAHTYEEKGMLGLGKIKYFRNTILPVDQAFNSTQREWSPWAFVAKFNVTPHYNLEANVVATNHAFETASCQIQYKPQQWRVVNFAYEYVVDPQSDDLNDNLNSNLNQVSLSTAWQVAAPWRILGKVKYDIRFHRFLETIAGFEYHTCCTAVRVLWSRLALMEQGIMHGHDNILKLQFIFKGLGSIGNAVDKYISSYIPGYEPMK